jgi:carbon monoxide dehydrogenase subunit G
MPRTAQPSRYVFDYRDQFRFAHPPKTVWAAIDHVECFEDWWAWLSELRVNGPGLRDGSVLEAVVSPPVPYRMRLRVAFSRCIPPSRIDAIVSGDLNGRAKLLLEPDHDGTRASVHWTIEMMQRRMRIAARVAPAFLRWGHDRVVDVTVAGLRRHLGELPGDIR